MNKIKYSLLLCSLLSISFSPSYLDAMKRSGCDQTSWWKKLNPFKRRRIQETQPVQQPVIEDSSISSSTNDIEMTGSGLKESPFILDENTEIPALVASEEVKIKDEPVEEGEKTEDKQKEVEIPNQQIEVLDLTQVLSTDDQHKYKSLIEQLPANFQKSGEVIAKILALFIGHSSEKLNRKISNEIEKTSGEIKNDISGVKAEVDKQMQNAFKQLAAIVEELKEQNSQMNDQNAQLSEMSTDLNNNISALRMKQKDMTKTLGSLSDEQKKIMEIQNSFNKTQQNYTAGLKRAIVVGTIVFAGTTFILYLPLVGGATLFSAVSGGVVASTASVGGTWVFYYIKDVFDSINAVRNKLPGNCIIL